MTQKRIEELDGRFFPQEEIRAGHWENYVDAPFKRGVSFQTLKEAIDFLCPEKKLPKIVWGPKEA